MSLKQATETEWVEVSEDEEEDEDEDEDDSEDEGNSEESDDEDDDEEVEVLYTFLPSLLLASSSLCLIGFEFEVSLYLT